jgi:aspartyl-tRNA(Asn)/glutamyl-tRNA(Gln) amidotransferase subunit A
MQRLLSWQNCGRRIHSSSAACRQASARLLDPYNAFTCFIPDLVANDASSSDALKGLRISVKDNFATRQGTTSCASKALEGYTSPYDATVVKQLLEHGARIVGKTNMDEFGMGSNGLHGYYGATTNPLDPDVVIGGSSSGAAASVAADLCDA